MSSNIENKNIENKNIKERFCPCVLVQGVKECPAKRAGRLCIRAHTLDEIQPKPCTREKEGEGCFCRDKPWPLTCVFLHEDESVEEDYPKRTGFDPEHKAYDNKTWSELNRLSDECYEHKKYFKDSIKWYEETYGDDISEEDLVYVKQTRSIVYLLRKKEAFLAEKVDDANHAEMTRLEEEGAYDIPHKDDNGDRYFRTPEEKAKNRAKVRDKFKRGKNVRLHDVFENENDEACYEEYSSMMEQEAVCDMGMEYSYTDIQLSIIRDWVEQTIEIWDSEDKYGPIKDKHLKDAWGDYRHDSDKLKAA